MGKFYSNPSRGKPGRETIVGIDDKEGDYSRHDLAGVREGKGRFTFFMFSSVRFLFLFLLFSIHSSIPLFSIPLFFF